MHIDFFLIILFVQLFFLSLFILLCSVSFIPETSQELEAASAFRHYMGLRWMVWEVLCVFLASILMRVCLNVQPRILLILSIVLYTIVGTFVACHITSILICGTTDGDVCALSDPSTIRGQRAIFVSTPWLTLSFIINHLMYYNPKEESMIIWRTLLQNTFMIVFSACISVCIIDDSEWDWKYAFAFLFTLGVTTYINVFSTFIRFSKDFHSYEDQDMWKLTAMIYLQPLFCLEESIKICLTT